MTPRSDEQAPSRPRRRATPPVVADISKAARGLPGRIRALGRPRLTRSPWFMGLVGAAWAAGIGLAIAALSMVLVWVATPASGLGVAESLHLAGLLWIVAHGTPVTIGAVTYSLMPWGLALVPLLLLGYAGGWSARRSTVGSVRDLVVLVASGVLAYSIVAAAVAHFSAPSGSSTSLPWAVLHAVILAAVAFGWGAARAARDVLSGAIPSWLRITVTSGTVGAVAILGFGAVGGAVALIARVDDAITMTQSLHAGVWGGLGLLLLSLAYVPVAIAWSASYVIGAGFVIGPAVAVSPFIPVTAPTQLPPFPMLAAVPSSATPAAWALPLLGVVAGILAGVAVARAGREESRLTRLVLAVGAAAVAGLILATAAFLADGALGDLRLAHLGPTASTVGLLTFVLVVLGAVPSAVAPSPPARTLLTVAAPVDTATVPESTEH